MCGAAAEGVIGAATAYALDVQKKRKEEEARARAEAERANAEARAREKGYDSYEAMVEAEAKAAFDANWNAMLAAQQAQAAANARQKAEHIEPEGVYDDYVPPSAPVDTRLEEEEQKWLEETEKERALRMLQEQEKACKAAELQAGLAAYYSAMRQGEQEAASQEKSWLQKAWDNVTNFMQEKVIQPLHDFLFRLTEVA